MNTSTATSYPLFLFSIPMESIGFRNAWYKQKHLSLHVVPWKHLAGRWDLSWHPPSFFGASLSPSWAFHSTPHQVLIWLSFFKYFPLGVCDNGIKYSDFRGISTEVLAFYCGAQKPRKPSEKKLFDDPATDWWGKPTGRQPLKVAGSHQVKTLDLSS